MTFGYVTVDTSFLVIRGLCFENLALSFDFRHVHNRENSRLTRLQTQLNGRTVAVNIENASEIPEAINRQIASINNLAAQLKRLQEQTCNRSESDVKQGDCRLVSDLPSCYCRQLVHLTESPSLSLSLSPFTVAPSSSSSSLADGLFQPNRKE